MLDVCGQTFFVDINDSARDYKFQTLRYAEITIQSPNLTWFSMLENTGGGGLGLAVEIQMAPRLRW